MEDEATKEDIQPSTSKKDSQRTNSGNDLYDDRERDEGASNSETSVSATYSARSRVEMVDARPEPPKPSTLSKREGKSPEKKKRGRRGGRVEKRRRSYRRQLRRAPMRRNKGVIRHTRAGERRLRDHSMTTIFSRLSSRSGSRTPGCVHCGHRCCRRRAKRFVVRYEYEIFRYEYMRRKCTCRRCRNRRVPKKKMVGAKKLKKKPGLKFFTPQFTENGRQGYIGNDRSLSCVKQQYYANDFANGDAVAFSKQIQTGSRSHMLSPLFINTNSTPEAEATLPAQTYCEVTPEMIFESLCVLNLWRQDVQTALILQYIMRNYPVNKAENELFVELTEKLRIASIVGIVTQTSEDFWALAGELEQRRLTTNHVTLFWQVYSDTLSPIPKREANLEKERSVLSSEPTRGTGCRDDLI